MKTIMKKVFLLTAVVAASSNNMHAHFTSNIATAVTVGVCLSSAAYVQLSEPNKAKIDRTYSVINKYQHKLDAMLLSIDSFEHMCLLSKGFYRLVAADSNMFEWIDEIEKTYADISQRNSSVLMLWSRSKRWHEAVHDITQLHDKAQLLKLVRDNVMWFNCNGQDDQLELKSIQCALVLNNHTATYPITTSVKNLQETIATLMAMRIDFPVKSILLEYLQRVCGTLMTSQQYQQEVRHKNQYLG